MTRESLKAEFRRLAHRADLTPSARDRIRSRLDEEIRGQEVETRRTTHRVPRIRQRIAGTVAVLLPVAVLGAGLAFYTHNRASSSDKVSINKPIVRKNVNSRNLVVLKVDSSHAAVASGPITSLIKGQKVHSYNFTTSPGTQATVLQSVDRDGTLVAVAGTGYSSKPSPYWGLYLLSARTGKVTKIGRHFPSLAWTMITSATMSQHWIAWTEFMPNGVLENIGVYNRQTGQTWYVASAEQQQNFLHRALSQFLFMRGNSLYVEGMNKVDEYNMQTHQWKTFTSSPNSIGFTLTSDKAVLEVAGRVLGRSPDRLIDLNGQGKQVGPAYQLPKSITGIVGTSGNEVLIDSTDGTYAWTPGSNVIRKISGVSSWLTGSGGRFLAGWRYGANPSGLLVDAQTERQYSINGDSALVTDTTLYWTKADTVYWVKLP